MVKTFIFHRVDLEKNHCLKSLRERDTGLHLHRVTLLIQGIALEIHLSIENEDKIRNIEEDLLPLPQEDDKIEKTEERKEDPHLLLPLFLEITEEKEETTMTRVIPIFPVRIETKFQVKSFGTDFNGHTDQTLHSEKA